jgi:hypothetical protein
VIEKQSIEGVLVDYLIGRSPSKAYCCLTVDLGPLRGLIAVSSRTAREFAIAVITNQGPNLGYQPPNKEMREHPSVYSFGVQSNREPRWKEQEKIERCARDIGSLIEKYGENAFGWALNSVAS